MSRVGFYLPALVFLGFALSAVAGETLEKPRSPVLENSALFPLLEGLLKEKSGLPLNSKQRPLPAKEATPKSESAAPRPESAPPPEVIVEGIIVRFQSPDIQALARANLPPPEAVVAELETALGEELVFHGAMVNEAHVFRFLTPKNSKAVAPLLFSFQWNLMGEKEGLAGGIEATRAWDITQGSAETIVAVVDGGVRPHPEFANRLLPGYDFVSDPFSANDGDGIDSDASDPGNWRTRILPVRVLGKCDGTRSDILNGMSWAAGLPVPGVPANPYPAQVINLSLVGFGLCPRSYQETLNKILGQGTLVVVAAGNDGDNIRYHFPANCQGVLTVIATDHKGKLASYSNVDFTEAGIAAPGGDISWYGKQEAGILSTVDKGATTPEGFASNAYYDWKQGTSMAAPHVSGIASLMLSVNPNLVGLELYTLLQLSSKPFPTGNACATLGFCGIGIADAYGSVAVASFLRSYRLVYEFYNVDLNHYFLTGSKEDAAIVNRGGVGPGWFLSNLFYAWSGPEEGALPVCRFYTQGANSHFYTASPEDCAYLKSLNPANVYAPDKWTYEGIAFYAKLPIHGVCPDDSVPVYRVYNNRWRENDSNHRFVTSVKDYQAMIAKGWAGEGVALCTAFGSGG